MKLSWDEDKRRRTLKERGLDFARCSEVFEGPTLSFEDDRRDYGEQRWVTVGLLDTRLVCIVSTDVSDECTRIISMRDATRRERKLYEKEVG